VFEWISSPEAWIALVTLTALEIVLGIDNIIFLNILVSRLPDKEKQLGRLLGLGFALLTRILLLLSIVWIIRLTKPWFTVFGMAISGRDLILILGGLFLMAKSTHEIHQSFEAHHPESIAKAVKVSFWSVIIQVGIMDIIFSLDSVITAVGLVDEIPIMVLAIVIAMIVMMVAAKSIGDFVDKHPTIKMLALSFLILIGVALLGEGFDMHIPKGYIYFAMAFSVCVEILNLRLRKAFKN
jgi:predicted tellurium resistance membrane protein TerC